MGKGNRGRRGGDKEYSENQRLKHENSKLKRQVAALEKQLARIDFTRFSNLTQLVDKQHKEAKAIERKNASEKVRAKWACHQCGKGVLVIKIWDHPMKGLMYYRKCSVCIHKTKMQPAKENIEGIHEGDE